MLRQTKHGQLIGVHREGKDYIMTVRTPDGTFKDYPHDGVVVEKTANVKRKKQ